MVFSGGSVGWYFYQKQKNNITVEMLKKVFEGLQSADEADELLSEIASKINENCKKYQLDTALRLSNFFHKYDKRLDLNVEWFKVLHTVQKA